MFGYALFLFSLLGCAPHGPLSLRQEAAGHFQAAIQISRINDIMSGKVEPTNTGELEDALAESKRSLAIDPLFFPAHLLAIQLLALLDRNEECEEYMMYLLELFPGMVSVREEIVLLQVQEFGNHEKASVILAEGIARNPEYLGFYLLRGEIAAQKGASAGEIMANAEIPLAVHHTLTTEDWVRVLGLCVAASKQEMNRRVAEPILLLARRAPWRLDQAVSLFYAAGLEEEAKNLFLYAAHLPEADYRLRLATARLLVRMGDGETAAVVVAALADEAKEGAQSVEIVALEGHIAWIKGKPADALDSFRRALDIEPACVDALEGLWLVYERTALVEVDEVRQRLEKAARSVPDANVAGFLMKRARSLQK